MAPNSEQQPTSGSIEGEFSAETDKLRSAAVEKIMDEGFPPEGAPAAEHYREVWDQVATYLNAVKSQRILNEPLSGYLQKSENAEALGHVIDQLKTGKSPNDLLAKEEAGPASRRYLSAFIALENVVKGTVRSEGGQRVAGQPQRREADLSGPQGEAARRLTRVAEIMDIESNALMIERGLNPLDLEEAREDYAVTFDAFVQRRDVPEIYRERARSMASNLRIDAMKKEKPAAPAPPSEPPRANLAPRTPEYREQVHGLDVKLEYDPSSKLFGKENPLQPDDLRHMQEKIEALTREANPKNAFAVAKLAAHLQRAGVRLGEGKKQLGEYLQRQRLAMQKHGPRALAQYLTYGKYAGFVNELSEQEHKWLMTSIQERSKSDPHTGLTRLCMNARYLGVSGYTPDLVRASVMAEIEALKQAGDVEGAATEAARARQAGIDPAQVFTTAGEFTSNVQRKLVEHVSAGRWDLYARLRNNLDVGWKHLPLLDKQINGLLGYFTAAREQARSTTRWDSYADYAAHVRELASRTDKRERGESTAPVTPEVRERGVFERARLTPEEYEEYLGGPEPAQAPSEEVRAEAVEESTETPDFREIPEQPVATVGWLRRFWGRLFGRGERQSSDQETPTDTAA